MSDTVVNFYESIDDELVKFAVIIAKHNGKYVFGKHKERNTWEVPGGHREQGEVIHDTACRELLENWTYPLIQPKLMEEATRRGVL